MKPLNIVVLVAVTCTLSACLHDVERENRIVETRSQGQATVSPAIDKIVRTDTGEVIYDKNAKH